MTDAASSPLVAPRGGMPGSPFRAPVAQAMAATAPPPIMEVKRRIAGIAPEGGSAPIDLSQAAPSGPPPAPLRAALAAAIVSDDSVHGYGPDLGDPALREKIAERWSVDYVAAIDPSDVAVTAGCNQAFCAAMATLVAPGDAVLLPAPHYFNHAMWLQMTGVETIPLACDGAMSPRVDLARAALTRAQGRCKAIVLVTPNNPTGAEYPAGVLEAFYDLAAEFGCALVVDETYRDFRAGEGPPHALFSRPDWRDRLIHLYSFSKSFRLTGYRTGAMVCSPERLAEVEKFIDCTTICPPRLGQRAALVGLEALGDWVREERAETLARRDALIEAAKGLPGWRLISSGAFFAWFEHPYERLSADLAPMIYARTGVLILPGEIGYAPGDPRGGRAFRMAYANVGPDGLREAIARLAEFRP